MGARRDLVEAKRDEICAVVRRHRGRSVAVFGSVARGDESATSDIDLSSSRGALHPEVAWRDVGALRVLLAHHYHPIDLDQVGQIATIAVPDLVGHLRNDDGVRFSSTQETNVYRYSGS